MNIVIYKNTKVEHFKLIFDFRFFLGGANMAQEPLKELTDNLLSIFK